MKNRILLYFGLPAIIMIVLGAFITLLTKDWHYFVFFCITGVVIGLVIMIANPSDRNPHLVIKKFGSVDVLAKEFNRFYATSFYKDSKIRLGVNGVGFRKRLPDSISRYDNLDLYKNIISVYMGEVYDNELISGGIVQAGLPIGLNIGLSAGRINLSSNKQILVGYAVCYCNKWGEQRTIFYEKCHQASADEVYRTLCKYCKNARIGDFDGIKEYIEENTEEL